MMVLMSVCPVFRSLPASGDAGLLRQLRQRRNVGAQVRRGVRVRKAFADRRVGVDHARRNRRIRLAQPLLERLERLVRGRLGQEHLGAPAPDEHDASETVLRLEPADVVDELLGQLHLVLALLDVRAVQPLHVLTIEHRRKGLDRRELILDAVEQRRLEHAGRLGGLVAVVVEDVPAAEDDLIEAGQRNELGNRGGTRSVRLPRRTVPICVSEPIGFARPLRIAMTPAMVVVLTAPRPTSRMPSLPSAGAIGSPFVTVGDYIIRDRGRPSRNPR